jgi:potassium/chloride transporter 4/5/6
MLLTMGRDGAVHAKNWRPQLLLFLDIDSKGNPKTPELLSLAGQMKLGRGLLLAVGLLKGDPAEEMERAAEAQRVLSMHLEDENIEGFAEVSVCADPREAAMTVMHHAGIGTMRPNAVFVNWCDDWSKNHDKGIAFVSMLRGAVRANKAAMVLKGALALPSQFETLSQGDTIDIWWIAHDGGLLLLVPYLLTLHSVWKRCQLRLYSVIVDERDDPRVVEREVRDYLEQIRIEAIVTAIDMSDSRYNSEAYTSEMNSRSQAAKDSNIGVGRVTASDTHGRKEGLGVQLDDDVEELEELELEDSSAAGGAHGTPAQRGKQKKYNRTKEGDSRTVAAVLLNRNMRRISSRARLIVTNLPLVPDMAAIEILEYVETISDSLSPVLLIRGTGQEVVTTIA